MLSVDNTVTANILLIQLLRSYETSDAWSNWMLANIDWYLLPVVNPDGYEYSMTTVSVQQLVVLTVGIKLSLFSGQGRTQDFAIRAQNVQEYRRCRPTERVSPSY